MTQMQACQWRPPEHSKLLAGCENTRPAPHQQPPDLSAAASDRASVGQWRICDVGESLAFLAIRPWRPIWRNQAGGDASQIPANTLCAGSLLRWQSEPNS
ncbi:MAG: hypothetical protein AB7K09_14650, partial [Planctomycetota bacterium]